VRSAALSLALLAAGCATAPADRPIADPAAVAADLATDPDDAATLAQVPSGVVTREGPVLTVKARHRTHRLEDAGACEGFGTCARFRADRILGADVLGIRFTHGESPLSYLLLRLSDGRRMLDVETRPVVGPGGRLAVVANQWDIGESELTGVAVIDLVQLQVVHHDRTLIDGVTIDGWDGPACVRMTTGRDAASRRPLWLWTDGGAWQTAPARPAGCGRTG
jgi:hypothetical protein